MRVESLGFRVRGMEFGIWGLEVESSGFRVWDLEFGVQGLAFGALGVMVQGPGFRIQGSGAVSTIGNIILLIFCKRAILCPKT